MERSLLIVGAGAYALIAYEIACDRGEFKEIGFVDDNKVKAPTGDMVLGKTRDFGVLSKSYTDVIVAIGNPEIRLRLLDQIRNETTFRIATLISPLAYVAPSANIAEGVIVEPFAVIHSKCEIQRGCLVCAGAVVNHESVCEECVHVDCNATVPGYMIVPRGQKVLCGTIYHIS